MKVTQYCRFLFVFILFLSKGYFSYSQKVEPDSVNIFKEEIEYRNFNPDSANPDFIPLDFRFLPADLLYSHKWDTLNASGSKFVFNKSDTVIIFLHCEPGHPCFVFPFKGKTISDFGYRGRRPHTGVDIKLNLGDTILCAFDGVVRMSRYYHGYGNMVIVRHKNGIETLYGHMSKRIVKVNQVVRAGDVLGLGGRTGHATGPHLHFETRYLETPFNPHAFIDFDNFCLISDTIRIIDKAYKYIKNARLKNDYTYVSSIKNDKKEPQVINHPSGKNYVIRQGDTLSGIAKRNGTTVKNICKLNNLTPTSILKLGRTIKLY